MSETIVNGTVSPGWEPVRDAFADNFAAGLEVGAGVSVYHRGQCVIDLAGGLFDASASRPYDADTLQLVFSTTKGITAVAVAIAVQRGLLDYDAPVVQYWPEFAAGGKERVTVEQLMSHQAGLITTNGKMDIGDVYQWETMTARLASLTPLWTPGTNHGYHAVTYGWLAGELVRRVDPKGRSFGAFVADEIVDPLGAELWIGLPEGFEPRVSPLIPSPAPEDPDIRALLESVMGPDSMGGRALSLDGTFPSLADDMVFNSRAMHAAEIPAANGITNARSLARIYAATLGPVDGVQLLESATVERASRTVTPAGEPDACLIFPTTFGMGFMTHGFFTPMMGPGSYGHAGAGGSVAFAHPGSEVAFAYVMNRMDANLAADPRSTSLIAAVQSVLG